MYSRLPPKKKVKSSQNFFDFAKIFGILLQKSYNFLQNLLQTPRNGVAGSFCYQKVLRTAEKGE